MHVLYLIRHGETDFNRDGRIQGHTESDLSERGRDQARRVGERLRQHDLIAAYTSPARRAVDTCNIALDGMVPVHEREGLREIHLGAWEGRKAADLRVEFPDEVRLWFEKPSAVHIDGAETLLDFRDRVTTTMDGIRGGYDGGAIAVFAHGGVICTYLTSLLGMSLDDIWRFKIRNGSLTRVIFPMGRPRIDLLGDIHHLDGVMPELPERPFRLFP